MMLRYLAVLMLLASVAFAGNVELGVTATTNKAAEVQMFFWTDPADTVGANPSWSASATVHSGDFDTGIVAAVANADSGGINISWTAATGHDGYRLDFDPNDDGWATASFIHVDSTTFGHDIGSTAEPRRGEINYRFRSFTEAAGDTTWSAVVLITDLFYNQAKRVYSKFHASDGATIVESDEGSALLVSYYEEGPDTAPPDTTGVFAGVVVDTTGADILLTLTDMTIDEPGQVEFQWSNNTGTSYYGDASWSPATASTTVGDTIHTTLTDPANLNDTYVRFRLRDDEGTPNVSGWSEHQQAFTRETPAGGTYDVASGEVWIATNTNASNVKIVLYDDTGAYLDESPSTTIGADGGMMTVNWPSGPTLVSGDGYYLCVIADGTVRLGMNTGELMRYSTDGTYASPPATRPTEYKVGGHLNTNVRNSSDDILLGFDEATVEASQVTGVDGELLGPDAITSTEFIVPTL